MHSNCVTGVLISSRRRFLINSRLLAFYRQMSRQTQADVQPQGKDDTAPESEDQPKPKRSLFVNRYNLKGVNFYLEEDSTIHSTSVIHPGFSPESINRYAHPSLPSVLKMATVGRMFAMATPVDDTGRTFLEYNRMTDGFLTFYSAAVVSISQHMYDPAVPKCPLRIRVQAGHIGRTSMSTVTSVTSPVDPDNVELMNQVNQVVLIDKKTRRPTPISDEWRQEYLPYCIRGEQLIIPRQQVPDAGPLSVYEVKIAWSDTDNYNHTNFASYPRFAVDAVHDALRLGKLGEHLSAKEIAAGISQVKMSYLGESVEGDVLQVKVWSMEGCERTIMCSMEKEGQVINQVMLSFYSA